MYNLSVLAEIQQRSFLWNMRKHTQVKNFGLCKAVPQNTFYPIYAPHPLAKTKHIFSAPVKTLVKN
jgi:hypothetical protein